MMKTTKMGLLVSAMAAFSFAACDEGADDAFNVKTVEQKIQNGQEESGFPAVGSIYVYDRTYRYYGSDCTGSLIRKNWVLTAAHCLDAYPQEDVQFLIGERATAALTPPEGAVLYAAKRFVQHPQWQAESLSYDIGLIELQEEVTGIDPMPLFDGDLTDYIGEDSKVIGYGFTSQNASNDVNSRKRSTTMEIKDVFDGSYYSKGDNTGVCNGDSGGPSLVNVDGAWQIAGVNSNLWSAYEDYESGTACLGPMESTRVDAFKTWILKEIGEPADCRQDETLCHCPEACQPDGLCEVYRCTEEATTCPDVLQALINSENDKLAYNYALANGSPEARLAYGRWVACYREEEGDMTEVCTGELLSCYSSKIRDHEGEASCQETVFCLNECEDQDCIDDCIAAASGEVARHAYELLNCAGWKDCPSLDAEDDCIQANCAAYLDCLESGEEDGGIEDAGTEDAGTEDGDVDSGLEDAGNEDGDVDSGTEDAGNADAGEDAGNADSGNADASEDAAVPRSDAEAKPAVQDAAVTADAAGEEDDDGGDDGCSAVPGSRGSSWLALFGLPLMLCRRRRRA